MKKNNFSKFILLWIGEFVSSIGSGLTAFGLAIYVFEKTGKASAVALVSLFAFLPSLILSVPAGVLADRYDRRLLMIIGDGLSALGLIFILFFMIKGEAKLWQVYMGVMISSIFISLLEPAYTATITDLLTKEQYTKAGGLVQIAGSSRFLISPALAGLLLKKYDIKLLLVIDVCTLFITIIATLVVRKGLVSKRIEKVKSFTYELKEGWETVSQNQGILILVIMASILTFFIGFIQTLLTPMILAFSDSSTLGAIETISASGMLITSIIMGMLTIKKGHRKLLSTSLFIAGLFMALFALRENIFLITIFGFLFFSALPFANVSLDYLIRSNIDNEVQGRAWGIMGLISQLGYIVAYAISGILADYVFTPLLVEGGIFANSLGKIFGIGPGRGIGLLIFISGISVCVTALILYRLKAIMKLESGGELYVAENNPQ